MSDETTNPSVRAVEVGEVIPRMTPSTSNRRYAGIGIILLAVAVALAILLEPPVRYTAIVPLLFIGVVAALAVAGRRGETLPRLPGVALQSFSAVDAECMADYLVGAYNSPAHGLPRAQIIIARVDSTSADSLTRIPDACEDRWNKASLQTILIAIPRGPPEAIAEVAEAFDLTLLVNDPAEVSALLGYLPDLVAQPEGQSINGVGAATIRQTPINDRHPSDPGLREDINKGRGKPLAPLARQLRDERSNEPEVRMASAPPDYIEAVVTALSPFDGRLLTVQHESPQIDLFRLYLTNEPASEVPLGQLRRDSIRNDGNEPSRQKPDPDCQRPASDAADADRSLSSSC